MTPLLFSGRTETPYPTGEDLLDLALPPFRVWIPEKPALVLGYSQNENIELNMDAAEKAGITIYKRKGGGGAVYLSPGCVCIAIRFARKKDFGIAEYFSKGNSYIATVLLQTFGLGFQTRGISDLAYVKNGFEKKVLGSSLYLPRHCALYSASLIVKVPMHSWDVFLNMPSREPKYRGGRSHRDFVQNIAEISGYESLTPNRVKAALEQHYSISVLPQDLAL